METAIQKGKKAMSFIPSAKEAISGGKDLGMIALGMIAGHAVVNLSKKDNAYVHGGMAVIGLGLYVKAKNPYVKFAGLGLSAFSTIKLINSGLKIVAAPASTGGLAGILPDSAKAALLKYIPQLSGIEDFAGIDGAEDEFDATIKGLDLDEEGIRGAVESAELEPSFAGMGSALDLAA